MIDPMRQHRSLFALLSAFLVLPALALADPPAACWSPAQLAARPGEAVRHWAGPADRLPVPAAATMTAAPVAGEGVVRRVQVSAGEKIVALTFDLCEGGGEIAGYDGKIVDYLRREKVPATFFMGGRWAQSHEERAMQLLSDPLFEIGDHSYDHADLEKAAPDKVTLQIARTEAVIDGLAARVAKSCPAAPTHQTRLFRFPFGACGADGPAAVRAAGLVPIQWDVVSGDPSGIIAAPMTRAVLATVKPGSIVVMHANGRGTHTAEALTGLVPALRARGYRFVTVSELLAAGDASTTNACFVLHPGDTAVYDKPHAVKAAGEKGTGTIAVPLQR